MSEEINPVLTAEEWARGFIGLVDEGEELGYVASGEMKPGGVEIGANFDAVLGPKDCARLAAFLLQRAGPDGGPLFTLEMVDALEESVADAASFIADRAFGAERAEAMRQVTTATDAIAALASLLPPREP